MPWTAARRRGRIGVAVAGAVAATLLVGCGEPDGAETDGGAVSPGSTAPTTTRAPRGDIATVDFGALIAALDVSAIGGDDERRPASDAVLEVADVDLADLDGDDEDEAAVTVRTVGPNTRPSSTVIVYRSVGGIPELVADAGWGRSDDHGVRDVAVLDGGSGPDRLVIQRFEAIEEECCSSAVEERTYTLVRTRFEEVGDSSRRPLVRRRAPMSPAGPARDPIAVSFFPGSGRFSITGDVADEMGPVTFDALAGQTLDLAVLAADDGEPDVTVTVTGPGGAVVTELTSGEATSPPVSLPTSGSYAIAIRGTEPVGDVPLDERAQFWIDADLGE